MSAARPLFLAARLVRAGLAWFALVAGLRAADAVANVAMEPGASADIRLTVPGGRTPQSGFLPMQVRIANRADSERSWTLEVGGPSSMRYAGSPGSPVRSRHEFTVPPSTTREFMLFAPVPSTGGPAGMMTVQVEIEGPEVERPTMSMPLGYNWSGTNSPLVIEPALEAPLRAAVGARAGRTPPAPAPTAAATRLRRASPTPVGFQMDRVSVIDPAAWPADWRLWSSFPLVILQQSTWERLDTAHRRALSDWVVLGGRLALSPAQGGEERRVPLGAGEIITLAQPLGSAIPDREAAMQGQSTERIGRLADATFWNLNPEPWTFKPRLGWLTGFIVVFGLLIGPANLFWLAPAGRRHRLFYTVPLISIGATLVLFIVIAFGDGFGGAGTRRTLVVLVPGQNAAAVHQRQISRTGLLGGRGFALPADTLIDRVVEGATSGLGGELMREGDAATGDWFTARTTQRHTLTRLVPTRERVEMLAPAAPDAAPVIQSTVGAALRDFVYRDAAGKLWQAAEVPPGVRVTLSPAAPGTGSPHFGRAPSAPGLFQAVGGAGSLVLPTLPAIRWRDDITLYTGRLVAAAAP